MPPSSPAAPLWLPTDLDPLRLRSLAGPSQWSRRPPRRQADQLSVVMETCRAGGPAPGQACQWVTGNPSARVVTRLRHQLSSSAAARPARAGGGRQNRQTCLFVRPITAEAEPGRRGARSGSVASLSVWPGRVGLWPQDGLGRSQHFQGM